MRKLYSFSLSFLIALFLTFTGTTATAGSGRIMASTFPIYQLTRPIADGVPGLSVELLLSAELGCPHDYSLTPKELTRLAGAEVLVVNGLGMEEFLDDALKTVGSGVKLINATNGIAGALPSAAEDEHAHHHHEHAGLNPHMFVSPRRAAQMAERIGAGLAAQYPSAASKINANTSAFAARLRALGAEFAKRLAGTLKPRLVGRHDIFAYLAKDTAFELPIVLESHAGLSPDAATLRRLLREIKSSGARGILAEAPLAGPLVETIAKESGLPVLLLDALNRGLETAPLDHYERVQRQNLALLERFLAKP